ncbi:MAG: DUF4854 domain-containing protein [Lachnospiraceae bacterium]|nr:DUF4854 domain-containing protein [Lachnospiraceae bacterium]
MKTIVCAALLALAMSVSACGSSEKTLEAYLKEDPAAMQQLEEQMAAQGDDTLEMSIEVSGNEVICIGTFTDSIEVTDEDAAMLQESLGELGSVFSAIAGTLDDTIGAEKGTVSYGIRYCDSTGKVLAEQSFKAE